MNEERFNLSVRQFLKVVGVTSQREIEKAVRERLSEQGSARPRTLQARMTLTIDAVDLVHVVDGEIELE